MFGKFVVCNRKVWFIAVTCVGKFNSKCSFGIYNADVEVHFFRHYPIRTMSSDKPPSKLLSIMICLAWNVHAEVATFLTICYGRLTLELHIHCRCPIVTEIKWFPFAISNELIFRVGQCSQTTERYSFLPNRSRLFQQSVYGEVTHLEQYWNDIRLNGR